MRNDVEKYRKTFDLYDNVFNNIIVIEILIVRNKTI